MFDILGVLIINCDFNLLFYIWERERERREREERESLKLEVLFSWIKKMK